ncbi:hypothetical protein [Thermoactinospora rubra]|uniref:hypothetical protein n=1 Tax=Thermoactinospora rubra TaxID=1088767 RepID=UPI001180F1E4|nr:hypothetical protein [Thermoactinospora rubra]
MTQLDCLADFLERHGLATRTLHDAVEVRNPVNGWLTDSVRCTEEIYVTSSGYEIGEIGDEAETADRLAFLLGVPHA